MSESDQSAAPADEELSALMDGEADASVAARASRHWRPEEAQRARWHAYHLIGDVLRSEDLAAPVERDEAFLQTFRARLALEPVVLAPSSAEMADVAIDSPRSTAVLVNFPVPATHSMGQSPQAPRRSLLRRWSAPMGMAAGVALVTGVVLMNRPGGDAVRLGNLVAQETQDAASAPATNLDPRAAENALLARYFSAHKQFSGTPVDAPPPSYLRNANYQQSVTTGR